MARFEIGVTKLWQKNHHFFEIVQYTCNTTSLYQNLMGNSKTQKMEISKYFSCYTRFFMMMYMIGKHKNLLKFIKNTQSIF